MAFFDLLYALALVGVLVVSLGCLGRVIERRRKAATPAPRPPPDLPGAFARLESLGFPVVAERDYSALGATDAPIGAVCYAPESVYPCRGCGMRGKFAFGEALDDGHGPRARIRWIGHVCGRCGHVERYRREIEEGAGFFGLLLEDAANLRDLCDALESYGPVPPLARMERALAEREAVLSARAHAVAAVRREVTARLGGASVTPFRSLHGTGKFLA